jgi:hypothetical protein
MVMTDSGYAGPGWAVAWNFPAWVASPAGQFEGAALAATTAAPPSPYYSPATVERALARALKGHPYTATRRDLIARFLASSGFRCRVTGQAQLMGEDGLPTQINELYQPVVTIFQRMRIVRSCPVS